MTASNANPVPHFFDCLRLKPSLISGILPRMVEITRKSILDGVERTISLPLTPKEYYAALISWENGAMIQDAFPMLAPAQREFIKTGITQDQWAELFGADDSEEN